MINTNVYHSKWLEKQIKHLVKKGKKDKTWRTIFNICYIIKKNLNSTYLFMFFDAIELIKPIIGAKIYKKKRGKAIQVVNTTTHMLTINKQYDKAIFWMTQFTKNKQINITKAIWNELNNNNNQKDSIAIRKKKETYYYAITYKSTKKFRW